VLPVRRPQPAPPRFLLDVHLGRLARRLRVLGLDTAYDRTADDAALTERAAAESRVLLTRDRGLLMRRRLPSAGRSGTPPWVAAYVRGETADEQLDDVLRRFAPPLAPWTRCPACNGELAAVAKADVAGRLEPGTRREYDEFARCPACDRVYWHGAHTRRLDELVARAARTVATAATGDAATVDDVHELALAMPHVTTTHGPRGNAVYQVGGRSFVFFRNPRPDATDPETGERYDDVIVIWVADEAEKQALVQDDASPFFTTPHFDGHPSVLVRASRLGELTRRELAEVVQDAWLSRASARRAARWLAEHRPGGSDAGG
jgi:uncharacterized protein with PIN domain